MLDRSARSSSAIIAASAAWSSPSGARTATDFRGPPAVLHPQHHVEVEPVTGGEPAPQSVNHRRAVDQCPVHVEQEHPRGP